MIWLKKNWKTVVGILLLLVFGFLLYVLLHKNREVVFSKQKTIDSLYQVIHVRNRIDSQSISNSLVVEASKDSQINNYQQNYFDSKMELAAATAQNELLAYKIKHTPIHTVIDSSQCQALADQVDIQTTIIHAYEANTDSLTEGLRQRIVIGDSILLRAQDQYLRTDSALTLTKSALDECATANAKNAKSVKRVSLLSKIAAGIAIIASSIVISDHIK